MECFYRPKKVWYFRGDKIKYSVIISIYVTGSYTPTIYLKEYDIIGKRL